MSLYNRFTSSARELEGYLGVIYDSYKILDLRSEWVIRGVLKPRFASMRGSLENSLRSFNGRYSFEPVGERTYLTISTSTDRRKGENWLLHILLFAATVFTTMLAGSLRQGGDPLSTPGDLALGVPFSFCVLLILLVHELGHYFAARSHGMDVTPPFFIPMPPPWIFGTMGALIKMRSPMLTRRTLLDMGAAGPIAGFVVSVPVTVIGLMSSSWVDLPPDYYILGHGLLYGWLVDLIVGPAPPGAFLDMSPAAFAGWIGFLVTAMNMIPVGQLDGGHVSYALFGRRHGRIAYLFFGLLLLCGLLWPGWVLLAMLILLVIRIKHPPVLDDSVPLGGRRRLIGWITFVILALTFMPVPIKI